MVRTALKLALVAIVANATWHLFTVYAANYKFKDNVQYAAQYRGKKSDEDLRRQVIDLAAEADVPIDPDQLTVTHRESDTTIDAAYTRVVELFPGFTYPWPFVVHVEATAMEPPTTIDNLRPK